MQLHIGVTNCATTLTSLITIIIIAIVTEWEHSVRGNVLCYGLTQRVSAYAGGSVVNACEYTRRGDLVSSIFEAAECACSRCGIGGNAELRVLSECRDTGAAVVREEINVEAVRFVENADELGSFELKPNYRTLGPRFGKRMPQVAAAVASLDPAPVVIAGNHDLMAVGRLRTDGIASLARQTIDWTMEVLADDVRPYLEKLAGAAVTGDGVAVAHGSLDDPV